jgi:hypothetical protein
MSGVLDELIALDHLLAARIGDFGVKDVKDRRGDQRGVNGSQSKFLTGIWHISQNQPGTPFF